MSGNILLCDTGKLIFYRHAGCIRRNADRIPMPILLEFVEEYPTIGKFLMFHIEDEEKWKTYIRTVNVMEWRKRWAYCDHAEYFSYDQLSIVRENRPEILRYISCVECYTSSQYTNDYCDFKIVQLFADAGYFSSTDKQKLQRHLTYQIDSNLRVIEHRRARNPEDKYSEHLGKDIEIYRNDLVKLDTITCSEEIVTEE